MEKWKDIKGYEGIYQVSDLGRVRRWRKKTKVWFYLKPVIHSGGYRRLKLRNSGNDKDVYIHRLVADAFLNDNSGEVVNHIDGDKTNNKLSNLEVISQRENISHGNKANRMIGSSYSKGSWVSNIYFDNVKKYLGSFKCETAAHFAYLKALKDNNLVNKYA